MSFLAIFTDGLPNPSRATRPTHASHSFPDLERRSVPLFGTAGTGRSPDLSLPYTRSGVTCLSRRGRRARHARDCLSPCRDRPKLSDLQHGRSRRCTGKPLPVRNAEGLRNFPKSRFYLFFSETSFYAGRVGN